MKTFRGFTLIELMVVVAIVAILAMVAVPNLSDMLAANRVQAEQRDFASALSTARSEAATRGKPVTLCRSSTGTGCGGNWSDGWIVFQDDKPSGTQGTVDTGETIIRVGTGGSATVAVLNTAGTVVPFVSFTREGYATRRTVRLCTDKLSHARAVLLEPTGRVALSQADPTTGIHKDVSNNALVCP